MKTLGLFFTVVRRDPLLIVCALFLLVVLMLALVGIHFTGYTYDQISDASLLKPSRAHWFGTDVNGHDLLTRTLYGAQISLFVAATGTIVSLTVGVTYGMISGYAGGRVDNLMMRVVEIIYSLPRWSWSLSSSPRSMAPWQTCSKARASRYFRPGSFSS